MKVKLPKWFLDWGYGRVNQVNDYISHCTTWIDDRRKDWPQWLGHQFKCLADWTWKSIKRLAGWTWKSIKHLARWTWCLVTFLWRCLRSITKFLVCWLFLGFGVIALENSIAPNLHNAMGSMYSLFTYIFHFVEYLVDNYIQLPGADEVIKSLFKILENLENMA